MEGVYNANTRELTWNLGDLTREKHSVTFAVVVQNTSVQTIDNSFSFIANSFPLQQSNTYSLTILEPGLNISKSNNKPNGAGTTDTVQYSINYSNNGEVNTTSTVITDTLENDLIYVDNSCSNSCIFDSNSNILTWNLATLEPNDSGTLSFETTINPCSDSVNITNIAGINSNQTDSQNSPINNLTVLRPSAAVSTEVNPQAIEPGENAAYSIEINNTGNTSLANFETSTTLDANQIFVSCSGKCSYDTSTNIITWTQNNLGTNSSQTYEAMIQASPSSIASTISNIVSVTSPDLTEEANDTVELQIAPEARAEVNIDNTKANLEIGDTDTFTINYLNTGTSDLSNAVLQASHGQNLEYQDPSCDNNCNYNEQNKTLKWDLGNLARNQSGMVTFERNVIDNTIARSKWFSISASALTLDNTIDVSLNSDELTTSATDSQNFAKIEIIEPTINVTSDNNSPQIGEQINYTIEVVGGSNSSSKDITIEYTLDDDLELIDCGGCDQNGNILSWTISGLNEGESSTITIQTRAKSSGSINNSLSTNTGATINNNVNDSTQITVSSPNNTIRSGSISSLRVGAVWVLGLAAMTIIINMMKKED